MKFIKLNMVSGVTYQYPSGEDDDDKEPVAIETTKPVVLDVEQVRNFYPRKEPHVGTRILFRRGSALAVTDLFDDVEQKIRAA